MKRTVKIYRRFRRLVWKLHLKRPVWILIVFYHAGTPRMQPYFTEEEAIAAQERYKKYNWIKLTKIKAGRVKDFIHHAKKK